MRFCLKPNEGSEMAQEIKPLTAEHDVMSFSCGTHTVGENQLLKALPHMSSSMHMSTSIKKKVKESHFASLHSPRAA